MDTNNEIQSTPHSTDPMWRADSSSGDHISPSIESNIPVHTLNHDDLSESQLESVAGSEGIKTFHVYFSSAASPRFDIIVDFSA